MPKDMQKQSTDGQDAAREREKAAVEAMAAEGESKRASRNMAEAERALADSLASRAREQKSDVPPAGEGEARIEYMLLEELPDAPRNAKKHDKAGIRRAFEQFGFIDPPLINETTGNLVAGHGRKEVLLDWKAKKPNKPPKRIRVGDGGRWYVPVIRGIAFETDEQAELYLLASNKLVENGGYDDDILAEILRDHSKDDLAIAGFSSKEVDDLLNDVAALEIGAPRATPQDDTAEVFSFRGIRFTISAETAEAFELAIRAYAEKHGTFNGFVEFVIHRIAEVRGV